MASVCICCVFQMVTNFHTNEFLHRTVQQTVFHNKYTSNIETPVSHLSIVFNGMYG